MKIVDKRKFEDKMTQENKLDREKRIESARRLKDLFDVFLNIKTEFDNELMTGFFSKKPWWDMIEFQDKFNVYYKNKVLASLDFEHLASGKRDSDLRKITKLAVRECHLDIAKRFASWFEASKYGEIEVHITNNPHVFV